MLPEIQNSNWGMEDPVDISRPMTDVSEFVLILRKGLLSQEIWSVVPVMVCFPSKFQMLLYGGLKVCDAAERSLHPGSKDLPRPIFRFTLINWSPHTDRSFGPFEKTRSLAPSPWGQVARTKISKDKENTRLIQFSGFGALALLVGASDSARATSPG